MADVSAATQHSASTFVALMSKQTMLVVLALASTFSIRQTALAQAPTRDRASSRVPPLEIDRERLAALTQVVASGAKSLGNGSEWAAHSMLAGVFRTAGDTAMLRSSLLALTRSEETQTDDGFALTLLATGLEQAAYGWVQDAVETRARARGVLRSLPDSVPTLSMDDVREMMSFRLGSQRDTLTRGRYSSLLAELDAVLDGVPTGAGALDAFDGRTAREGAIVSYVHASARRGELAGVSRWLRGVQSPPMRSVARVDAVALLARHGHVAAMDSLLAETPAEDRQWAASLAADSLVVTDSVDAALRLVAAYRVEIARSLHSVLARWLMSRGRDAEARSFARTAPEGDAFASARAALADGRDSVAVTLVNRLPLKERPRARYALAVAAGASGRSIVVRSLLPGLRAAAVQSRKPNSDTWGVFVGDQEVDEPVLALARYHAVRGNVEATRVASKLFSRTEYGRAAASMYDVIALEAAGKGDGAGASAGSQFLRLMLLRHVDRISVALSRGDTISAKLIFATGSDETKVLDANVFWLGPATELALQGLAMGDDAGARDVFDHVAEAYSSLNIFQRALAERLISDVLQRDPLTPALLRVTDGGIPARVRIVFASEMASQLLNP